MRTTRWIALLVTFLLAAWFAPAAGAAGPTAQERAARAEHQRVVDFWTPARVAKAVPRDFVLDPATGKVVPNAKPSGGGTTTTSTGVTGASWAGGGAVVKTTGKVLFALGTSYYVCSASVINDGGMTNRSLILTAAHCVMDEKTGAFATNWTFIPDYDSAPASLTTNLSFCGQTSLGCWSASAIAARGEFARAGSFNTQAITHDFAIVAVGAGGKSGTADLDATVGAQAVSFAPVAQTPTTSLFGYPSAQKYNGKDLTYSRGVLGTDSRTSGATYRVTSDMTGGSSGGPWFTPFTDGTGTGTVMSVNSYGYKGVTAMFGPKLNQETQELYDLAKVSAGNATVG
jgi:hypothetical protein